MVDRAEEQGVSRRKRQPTWSCEHFKGAHNDAIGH